MDTPQEKASSLLAKFKTYEFAYLCTEEVIGGLYDEGIREPEYWYSVQKELDTLSGKIDESVTEKYNMITNITEFRKIL